MRLPKDPRWLQIAFLCSFLLLGLTTRDFPVWHAPLLFASCLGTQLACERLLKLPHAGLLSPIIVPHIGLAVSRRETEVAFTRHQRRAPAHDIPSERVGERSPALLLQIPGTGVIWKITNAAARRWRWERRLT